ncbi:MAG: hypothetical protein K2G40_05310, partial [Muribaculaceae bacterium]|nr:hypothetical protein [Muribaculaceae bacterium]
LRLLRGCIFSLIGVALGIFVGIMCYNGTEPSFQFILSLISLISLAIGIGYLIVYFVTRKSIELEKNDDAE